MKMVKKIGIALTEEMNKVLNDLREEANLSKSRLIETFLREHPVIKKKLSQYRFEEVACCQCGRELGSNDVKIDTPKYGVLCVDCWAEKVGEFVEEHPISDRKSYAQR